MSTQVQYRRGSAAENNSFTGALAEITVDTTNGTLRVHNGITSGGSNIATVAYVTSQISSLSADSISNGTSNVKVQSSGGNVAIAVGGTSNVAVWATTGEYITGLISATGNITGGNLSVGTGIVSVGSIVNNNANAVGNIGSSSKYFNTVFALATSALYADLAEMYEADQPIEAGTVVAFGGNNEVTTCRVDASRRVAGVVSTNPSYLMNSGQVGEYVVPVALQGRVPVRVTGTIQKGDMMVSTGDGRARAESNPAVGSVIGKALADFDGQDGVIEVAIGRV